MSTRTIWISCLLATAFVVGCSSTPPAEETTAASRGGTGAASRSGGPTSGGEDYAGGGACTVGAVYFAYDSSTLDQRARDTLATNASCLQQRRGNARVTGMTDPRGTEEYNLALGDRRARTATAYLRDLGVEEQRMNAVSAGEERATGDDERGWSQDRRADIELR